MARLESCLVLVLLFFFFYMLHHEHSPKWVKKKTKPTISEKESWTNIYCVDNNSNVSIAPKITSCLVTVLVL